MIITQELIDKMREWNDWFYSNETGLGEDINLEESIAMSMEDYFDDEDEVNHVWKLIFDCTEEKFNTLIADMENRIGEPLRLD